MKVLVICDDFWHPGSVVHEGLDALAAQSDGKWHFDYIDDGREWSAARMAQYDVAILAKSDNTAQADKTPWVTAEVEQGFYDWVASGKGLLAMHSGTVVKDKSVLRALLGGTFDHHPKQCPVTCTPVAGHPLTEGVETFTAMDEHYHMIMDAEDIDLFMSCSSEHSTQPGGWTRSEGAGRVCVLTPGHNVQVWLAPAFQRLIDNALSWCVA